MIVENKSSHSRSVRWWWQVCESQGPCQHHVWRESCLIHITSCL